MEARIQATNTHFIVVGRDPETMLNFGATAKARSSIGNLLWHCPGAHLEVAVAPIRLRVGCVGTLFGSSERSPRTFLEPWVAWHENQPLRQLRTNIHVWWSCASRMIWKRSTSSKFLWTRAMPPKLESPCGCWGKKLCCGVAWNKALLLLFLFSDLLDAVA